jgi:hypothetical protein
VPPADADTGQMDTGELRDLSTALQTWADEIDGAHARIETLLRHVGRDEAVAGFRQRWTDGYRHQLRTVAAELDTLAAVAGEQGRSVTEPLGTTGATGATGTTDGLLDDAMPPVRLRLVIDYLDIAQASYDPATAVPGGYRELGAAEQHEVGIGGPMTSGLTGLRFRVCQGADDRYVVAFAGSHPLDHRMFEHPTSLVADLRDLYDMNADWLDNDVPGAVLFNAQEIQAQRIASAITRHAGAAAVTFTGHSLGGQLAAVSAVSVNSEAITFNAAAPSVAISRIPGFSSRARRLVTNFVTTNDPLTNGEHAVGISAAGRTVRVHGNDRHSVYGIALAHDLPVVRRGLLDRLAELEARQQTAAPAPTRHR